MHNPNYRGNFAPQVAQNIIEMYSQRGDVVLDPMCGGRTTLIECKLLRRSGIGVDINPEAVAVMMTGHRQEVADTVEEAMNNKAYTCLYKPLDMGEVLNLVNEIQETYQNAEQLEKSNR